MALAIDGVTSMIGCHCGLTTCLKNDVYALVNAHCIAHQEALSANDEFKIIPELLVLDQFAKKVYEWVGRSSN